MNSTVIEIVDLNDSGQGVGRLDGLTVFVDGATIGDQVTLGDLDQRSGYAVAQVDKFIKMSTDRAEAPCPHFLLCGGCQLQNISYVAQLAYKQKQLAEALQRIGKLQVSCLENIVAADNPYGYRNKVQVPVVSGPRLGYYALRSHDVVDMQQCPLSPSDFLVLVKRFREFMAKNNITAYDEASHKGLVRHLVIRQSDYLKELLVGLVINGEKLPTPDLFEDFFAEVNKDLAYKITSVVVNINKAKTNRILGDKSIPLMGAGFITEKVGGFFFKLSLDTFLQVNTSQATKAYDYINQLILPGATVAVDLYCGVGTIAINVADKVGSVVGVEENKQAIKDAKRNALNNARTNCTFQAIKAEFFDFASLGQVDLFIVDPPRKGLHLNVANALRDSGAKQIIYMSCNPATLARDLAILSDAYDIVSIKPFDFFPQTTHVESVVDLRLR